MAFFQVQPPTLLKVIGDGFFCSYVSWKSLAVLEFHFLPPFMALHSSVSWDSLPGSPAQSFKEAINQSLDLQSREKENRLIFRESVCSQVSVCPWMVFSTVSALFSA